LAEPQILIIDDEVEMGSFFRRLLHRKDFEVTVALNGAEAGALIRSKSFDVAMVDLKLPDADGLSLLQMIKKHQPGCEAIIMTGYSTTRTAVKAIQLGAFDYLEKPFDNIDEVERLIEKAIEYKLQGQEGHLFKTEWADLASKVGFQVGVSREMHRLASIAYKIARKNINVLIQGETGTGKEVLARFIHAASNRSGQAFTPLNCGALPENLLESELFGHEKGAFTGANTLHRGIFEMANRGTLFLDEVGESSPSIQVKLLRVLETGEFFRVGGERPIKTDVRVLAATNANLEQALKDKSFREDLFYRLDVVRLELPPLRNRREDIPLLSDYFINKLNPEMRLSKEALQLIKDYHWHGNIRELANTIGQAVALCEGKKIMPEHLGNKLILASLENPAAKPGQQLPEVNGSSPLRELEDIFDSSFQENVLGALGESRLVKLMELMCSQQNKLAAFMGRKGILPAYPAPLAEVEAGAIRNALSYCQGNITLAARTLGIGRNSLYRKIKDYNIKI